MFFSQRKLQIDYVANSGVMISSKDRKILIDGIHTEKQAPYYSVSPKQIEKMILNREPFHNIDILFFTHHHTDHFNPIYTNEFLKRNKHVQLIGTTSVLNMLASCDNYNDMLANQIRPISLPRHKSIQMNLRSIAFEVTSVAHDGEMYQGVENFGYLIEIKNKLIMHVGDAQPSIYNFQNSGLYNKNVDVLIVPFPFIGLEAGRKIINALRAAHVIVTHLPDKSQDEGNWLYNTYRLYKSHSGQLPKTTFFTKPGQRLFI